MSARCYAIVPLSFIFKIVDEIYCMSTSPAFMRYYYCCIAAVLSCLVTPLKFLFFFLQSFSYENCPPVLSKTIPEDSNYQSLDLTTMDQNQTYSHTVRTPVILSGFCYYADLYCNTAV